MSSEALREDELESTLSGAAVVVSAVSVVSGASAGLLVSSLEAMMDGDGR